MVLGLRSKNKKLDSIRIDYLVHVQEIKPWPPSQSLKSVQSVLLQWENGDQYMGSFSPTSPSLAPDEVAGKIEFNEFFRLPVTLYREKSGKSKTGNAFQKNCLEFSLFELKKDRAFKGQLLGNVIINLADYGILGEAVTLNAPMSCKKSSKNTLQPVMYGKIQPFEKDSSSTSSKASFLSKEASLDRDGRESVSDMANEDDIEEEEIASFTDYEISSHSSRNDFSSALDGQKSSLAQNEETEAETENDTNRVVNEKLGVTLGELSDKMHKSPPVEAQKHLNMSLPSSSSSDLSSGLQNPVDNPASLTTSDASSLINTSKTSVIHNVESSSFLPSKDGGKLIETYQGSSSDDTTDSLADKVSHSDLHLSLGSNEAIAIGSAASGMNNAKIHSQHENANKAEADNDLHTNVVEDKSADMHHAQEEMIPDAKDSLINEIGAKVSEDTFRRRTKLGSETLSFSRRAPALESRRDKLKHMKSVQLAYDSNTISGSLDKSFLLEKAKKPEIPKVAHVSTTISAANKVKETKDMSSSSKQKMLEEQTKEAADTEVGLYANKKETKDESDLKCKVEMLEEELKEAAAVEVSLYAVVAEHGGSTNKVHTPARRLSRFYLHAKASKASTAKAAVSGLLLVSKACGNDVPRLTFWLSNTILLRAILKQALGETTNAAGSCTSGHQGGSSPANKLGKNSFAEGIDDWEDPQTFTTLLGKLEAWIFSRIVESIWWQTLTPPMQSSAAKTGKSSRKTSGRANGLGNQEQGNFSIDLWKKAFKDACERLCPVQAAGHECGCLPILARMVMEQLVGRLDVAMFNAILRESAEDMPTDPVSDPISDPKVLPIPAGRTSFGAGAQLKNAIGNWSRWLTDLFGIDDDDSYEGKNKLEEDVGIEYQTSFKPFPLLNALSDLMMLPMEMLADSSTRKEICPIFGPSLIRRVLSNFVPDEFSPNPIPDAVLEAIDEEESDETAVESLTSFPCAATPMVYSPPLASSLVSIIGEVGSQPLSRSGSSVLRKSYTSDDELEDLDSPVTLLIADNFRQSPTSAKSNLMPEVKGGRNIVRYQLLRQVWKDCE
ncbi:NT-type C2 domain [Dillenia turbinata]|uniref:NT-type C2 domain n=1 Tax=Dillenia turbinata TaxID=194707 RepID=A0AAN8VP37_9MAGN